MMLRYTVQFTSIITRWNCACLVCATHNPGRAIRPPLCSIPVAGPFDHVGVDVIQFPRSNSGNQYAVVFVDYLTSGQKHSLFLPDHCHYYPTASQRDHEPTRGTSGDLV